MSLGGRLPFPAAAPEPLATVEAPGADIPARPDAATLARAIYRVGLEQHACVTLLWLAEALHPQTFAAQREGAPVHLAVRPEPTGA